MYNPEKNVVSVLNTEDFFEIPGYFWAVQLGVKYAEWS